MEDRMQIENQIRELLATEAQAVRLSNLLFAPDGLFAQLAASEQERREVAASSLFREALRRVSELERTEAAAFARSVSRTDGSFPAGSTLHKVEISELPTT
jgi:hypothetical protein